LCGLDDVPAPAVVEADVENQPVVGGGADLGLGQPLTYLRRQGTAVTRKKQARAPLAQGRHLAHQGLGQQVHQAGNLVGRTLPVLGREGKDRQDTHATVQAQVQHPTQRFDTLAVAGQSRQETLPGPAPVAVHDDGDVARHVGRFGYRHAVVWLNVNPGLRWP
jgi:hypothetical protein